MKNFLCALIGSVIGIVFVFYIITSIPKEVVVDSNNYYSSESIDQSENASYSFSKVEIVGYHVEDEDVSSYMVNNVVDFGKVDPVVYVSSKSKIPTSAMSNSVVPNTSTQSTVDNKFPWNTFSNSYTLPAGFLLGYSSSQNLNIVNVSVLEKEFLSFGVLPVKNEFYLISSDFGIRTNPFDNTKQEFHSAIDIAATNISGAEVYAMLPGVVSVGSEPGGYGNYIKINHGSFYTLYAHLQTVNVKEGDSVTSGKVIGTVGSSGLSTAAHLHLEVVSGEYKVSPKHFLSLILSK